jgi:hypothetical protein
VCVKERNVSGNLGSTTWGMLVGRYGGKGKIDGPFGPQLLIKFLCHSLKDQISCHFKSSISDEKMWIKLLFVAHRST